MKKIKLLSLLFLCLITEKVLSQTIKESSLWGPGGVNWDPKGRLPDYSYAGYGFYDVSIPNVPQKASLASTSAIVNDANDDSDALQALINAQTTSATNRGAILIPKGRWIIRKPLKITKSGLTLKGEVDANGKPLSELYFPIPHPTNRRAYWIEIDGNLNTTKLGNISTNVSQGTQKFNINYSGTTKFAVGDIIQIVQNDKTDKSLMSYLHGNDDKPGDETSTAFFPDVNYIYARVKAVNGNEITIDRNLPNDIRTTWTNTVARLNKNSSTSEIGLENLIITCNNSASFKHGVAVSEEPGYRMISYSGVTHCWAKNMIFNDMDEGIRLQQESCLNTCTKIVFQDLIRNLSYPRYENRSTRGYIYDCEQRAGAGHHPLTIWHAYNNVMEDIEFKDVYWHELSVEGAAAFNVFHKVKGIAVAFDNHSWMPYSNLWTEIDLGRQERLWFNSGQPQRGPKAGWRNTYWNIDYDYLETREPIQTAEINGFAFLNLIGLPRSKSGKSNQFVEITGTNEKVAQPNLFLAQVDRRRKVTSVDDVSQAKITLQSLSVSPNPSEGVFYLSRKSEWILLDAQGHQILKGDSDQVSLIDQIPGIYFLVSGEERVKLVLN